MNGGLFFRQLVRESRGSRGRLAFFAACLGTGVAAVVAVAGLSGALEESVRSQARPLLGADVAVESFQPSPVAVESAFAPLPGTKTRTDELVTVLFEPGAAAAAAPARR